jgi:hypothetical protein
MRRGAAHATFSIFVIYCLVLMSVIPSAGQRKSTQPKVLRNPDVRYPVYFDVSPPLSEMAKEAAPQPGLHLAPPVLYPKQQLLDQAAQLGQAPVKDGALQKSVGPLVSATIGLNLLGVGNGFPGYSVPDAPTDVNLAVGDTQVVQWVNVSYAVFDKTTGATIAGPIAGNQFWAGFGGLCQTDNSGDIIAQWDKIAHRWVMTQNTFQSGYNTCLAVSTTADATGTYYRFAFSQPGFPDYPKWGLMPDAYYQSQNNFGPAGAGFVGAYVCAYERAKLLAGDSSAKQICFQNGTFDDSMLPADLDSAGTLPPSGQQEVYLGSIDNGSTTSVYEYLFHVDFTTPSNSTFTGGGGTMPITVASFSLGCGGNGACIPQHGVTDQLDSLGDRLMYRLAYRNFSDHQTWLVNHAVTAGSSVGERWYEFHAPEGSTTLSVNQQGTFAPDGNYRWMGSIAMDQNQDIALGYSVSGSNVFPSIDYTGRVPSDAPGTMESEAQIVAGTGSQTDTSNRWGDYTGMAIDAADDCTFWYTNQYYMTTASFDWSTRLASFKFAGCGTTTPDFTLSASPPSQTVNPGNSTTYTVTVTPLNSFSGTVNLTVSGCPSNTTCTLNPASVTLPPTQTSTLTVQTTSSTPVGTFTLTITGTRGTLTHTTTVNLIVAVPDFSLSASPSSQAILPGSNTSYSVTVNPLNGYTNTVSLTLSGCPTGATCSISPSSVGPPYNASTLSVTTTIAIAPGNYTITITGTDGTLTRNTSVNLAITDFSISTSPSSRTVKRASQTFYTTTVTAVNGFNGSVTLGVGGLPSGTTGMFSPNPVAGAGSSTLTIRTGKKTPTGTFTLTITGTSSGRKHSNTVSLTINH